MSLGKPHKMGNAEQTRRLAALTGELGEEEEEEETEEEEEQWCRSPIAFPDHCATSMVTTRPVWVVRKRFHLVIDGAADRPETLMVPQSL